MVFQHGKSSANRQFIVYKLPKEGQRSFRVGISVSKKIGNAVTRNRVKRLIREAVASLEDAIQAELDLVVIARQGTEEMSFESLRSSLVHVMKRANALKQSEAHSPK